MDKIVKGTNQVDMPKIFNSKKSGQIDDVIIVIPEEHKQIVRERIEKYENNPGSYLSWDEIESKMASRK